MRALIIIAITLLTSLQLLGQTNFQGGIYSNTTWTKDKSPYIITGNVALFPSKTLTIESGVEIKFNGNYYFEIRGKLITTGTAQMPVIFTSNLADPQKNDWIGLLLNFKLGASANCRFTVFSYANIASSIESSQTYYGDANGIYFNNCRFINNNTALFNTDIDRNYAQGITHIDSCTFSFNNNGIKGPDWNISNSEFTNNINGMYETLDCKVTKTLFQNNSGYGIYSIYGIIDSCTINKNNIGIKNHYYWENEITNNTISENSIGIEFSEPIYISNWGFNFKTPTNNTISNNLIYNVENLSDRTKDLSGNYWGTSDSTLIEDKLKDGYDDITLGLINYDIYDSNGLKIKSVIKVGFTGLKDNKLETIVKIYPTYVTSELKIDVNELEFKALDISIYSTCGQMVYSSKSNSTNFKINLENIASGIYIVAVKSGSCVIKKKIIKK